MPWYCSIFATSTGSVLAVEDHSVTRDLGGGMGKRGTIHMPCFYSNRGPGAWVYCLLTTFKQASCWMPSNAATKVVYVSKYRAMLGTRRSIIPQGPIEFPLLQHFSAHREVSADHLHSNFGYFNKRWLSSHLRFNRLFFLKPFLDLLTCSHCCLQMCSTDNMLQTKERFLCVQAICVSCYPASLDNVTVRVIDADERMKVGGYPRPWGLLSTF